LNKSRKRRTGNRSGRSTTRCIMVICTSVGPPDLMPRPHGSRDLASVLRRRMSVCGVAMQFRQQPSHPSIYYTRCQNNEYLTTTAKQSVCLR